jgi:hypothetical protein
MRSWRPFCWGWPGLMRSVAIQQGMDHAGGRWLDHWVELDQLRADLGCAPTGVLPLDPKDGRLYLERQLVGMAIRASCPVLQSPESFISVAIKDLVAGLAGDAELPAHDGHLIAIEQAGHKSETFIHTITLIPGHLRYSPNAELCNLCARNTL